MGRNDLLEIPAVDAAHALAETFAILGGDGIPDEALLPGSGWGSVVELGEDLGQKTGGGGDGGARVLLVGREVEEEVGLDEGAGGSVEEDELLVGVGVDELDGELLVEVGADGGGEGVVLVGFGEDVVEGGLALLWILRTLLGQTVGPKDFGGREGRVPGGDVDVVFHVRGDDVGDVVGAEGRRYLTA